MRIRLHHTTFLLAAAAAAIAIAGAPNASAAPSEQSCSDAGGSTNCQRPGHVQVHTSPHALPAVFPPSINPRWRDNGYSARFPEYGYDPKWQAFGYNPLYSGFQPRPSVLRRPAVPQDRRCPTRSSSACAPQIPNGADTGGSSVYQKAGNAQITAQLGLAAQHATQSQYPTSASTSAEAPGPTVYRKPDNSEITARPGSTAMHADQQAEFFPVPDLPTL